MFRGLSSPGQWGVKTKPLCYSKPKPAEGQTTEGEGVNTDLRYIDGIITYLCVRLNMTLVNRTSKQASKCPITDENIYFEAVI